MKFRTTFPLILSGWLAVIGCTGESPTPAVSPPADTADAGDADLHMSSIVIDTHNDVIGRVLIEGVDLRERLADGHSDIPRFFDGGLDAQFFSIWPDPIYGSDHSARRTLQEIDALYEILDAAPDQIELATTSETLRRIVSEGKIAALMGIEGGHAIEDDLGLLRIYHRLGVRYMTLTHFNTNNWADSSGDEPRWGGLSPFGEEVVLEMNRLGMIVDISHVSDETFWDVMGIVDKPVIASHSACRSLCDHPRNLSDDMIRAVAENGGVIGINFYPEFIDQSYKDQAEAERGGSVMEDFRVPENREPSTLDRLAAERHMSFQDGGLGIPQPPFESVMAHFHHVIELVGADHVGLGSDFDGIDVTPEGLEDVTDYPDITKALQERGYSDEDIRKILGENFLRVLKEVTGE